MNKYHKLSELGQSIWYDNISRALLDAGAVDQLVVDGVMGVTSNPSIFQNAIAKSDDYDAAIAAADASWNTEQVYESMAIEDIGRAADIFRPVFDKTYGVDGFISLEVSPTLANDTAGTIAAARRLYATLCRPNIMIKVPATPAGIPAIEQLIEDGININVTLLFSVEMYEKVMNAYINGLEKRFAAGKPISHVASVASFFISRVDVLVDGLLAEKGNTDLQGKIGIANAKIAYDRFNSIFSGKRWEKLVGYGARVQRPLWASTGTKNPAYPDTLYVDTLIGPNTVNTVPPKTLSAFIDHGTAASTLADGTKEAYAQLADLKKAGIDIDAVTDQLLDEGVGKFDKAFSQLMDAVKTERAKLAGGSIDASLGKSQAAVDAAIAQLTDKNIVARIWDRDHTVWREDPTEISNRLGWLDSPETMQPQLGAITGLRDAVVADGYTDAVLLGMGGSSLAPEVFYKTFGGDGLRLRVLDSTDADRVHEYTEALDVSKTLFVVATKSGGTAETLSFFKHFYNVTKKAVGASVGEHFAAVTDPGSKLETIAKAHDFRATFINDPTIGGRYSALSFFGLLAAGLVGVDLDKLLNRARITAVSSQRADIIKNDAAHMGAIMGALALEGIDKVTLVASPQIEGFGDWVEQLIAESTGKDGKGILPVVGEPVSDPDVYGTDRLFAYMRLDGDDTYDMAMARLVAEGFPVIVLPLDDVYDMGGQFLLWEFATVIAGHLLDIQPFDQPNVESAKISARGMITAFNETGKLPEGETADLSAANLTSFLASAKAGDYISIHAYIQPTETADAVLKQLQTKLRDEHKLAVTVGYGPRFLHSTGQLHKGDGGNGLFIQLISQAVNDLPIPDETGKDASVMSFDVLKQAQSLGDAQALIDNNRRLIRFNVGQNAVAGIQKLI